MTILITGGTGTTGLALAKLASSKGYKVLITSRSGKAPEPFTAVKFDWNDTSTFENPFNAEPTIGSIYLVAPPIFEQLAVVAPFIDFSIAKGVKRFVLLSASGLPRGAPMMGRIHEYLAEKDVEYTVLRPTWFAQNFDNFFGHFIRNENSVISVAGDGKIPFVNVDDIAQAALDGLTSASAPNKDYYVVGPELVSNSEVAALLSKILSREITYKKLSIEEYQALLHGTFGLDKGYAVLLAKNEAAIANGTEVEAFNSPAENKIIGKVFLEQYFRDNAATWAVSQSKQ